jgi:restriction system protein
VQCKQWRALKVGVTIVRELYGVMAAQGATGGFVVTSGTFTPDAIDFAKGRNIDLIDGPKLAGMIRAAARSRERGSAASEVTTVPNVQVRKGVAPQQSVAPKCPKCGEDMVKRIAKQGSNAGKAFWGCRAYPQCRGIRGGGIGSRDVTTRPPHPPLLIPTQPISGIRA